MRVLMFVYVILLWSLLFSLRFPTVPLLHRAHPSRLFPLLRPLRSRVHNNGSILKRETFGTFQTLRAVIPWLLSIVFLQNPTWQNPSLPQLTASLCLTSFLRTTLHHQPQTPALSGVALHFYPCFAPPLTHLCVQSFHLPSSLISKQFSSYLIPGGANSFIPLVFHTHKRRSPSASIHRVWISKLSCCQHLLPASRLAIYQAPQQITNHLDLTIRLLG